MGWGTYEVNDEAAVAVTASRAVEEGLAVGGTGLAEDCGQATSVGVGIAEVVYSRKVA